MTLEWNGKTTQRETDTCTYTDSTSKCNRYRATKIEPRYGRGKNSVIEYGATYHRGEGHWWSCEAKHPYVGGFYPKHYPTLEEAQETCQRHSEGGGRKEPAVASEPTRKPPAKKERHEEKPVPVAEVKAKPKEEVKEKKSQEKPAPTGRAKVLILGRPGTAMVRWMSSQGWDLKDIHKVLQAAGADLKEKTVECQIRGGKNPALYGPAPELEEDEVKQLKKWAGKK